MSHLWTFLFLLALAINIAKPIPHTTSVMVNRSAIILCTFALTRRAKGSRSSPGLGSNWLASCGTARLSTSLKLTTSALGNAMLVPKLLAVRYPPWFSGACSVHPLMEVIAIAAPYINSAFLASRWVAPRVLDPSALAVSRARWLIRPAPKPESLQQLSVPLFVPLPFLFLPLPFAPFSFSA